jgi:hypothetical protein
MKNLALKGFVARGKVEVENMESIIVTLVEWQGVS